MNPTIALLFVLFLVCAANNSDFVETPVNSGKVGPLEFNSEDEGDDSKEDWVAVSADSLNKLLDHIESQAAKEKDDDHQFFDDEDEEEEGEFHPEALHVETSTKAAVMST